MNQARVTGSTGLFQRNRREAAFDHAGASYVLKGQQASPRPVQSPHPPLILGGRGGPKSAALAARYASEYNAFSATPEEAADRRAALDAACAAVGRDPRSLVQSTMITAILGDSDQDAEARARRITAGLAPDAFVHKLLERMRAGGFIGSAASVAARLRPFEAAGVERLFVQNFDFADVSSAALIGELARALA